MNSQIPLTLAEAAEEGLGIFFLLFVLAIVVLMIVSLWKMFEKAGEPGWAAIIPIYNMVVMCRVGGKPGWWVIWYFVPIANIVVPILVALGIAECFGQGAGFGIGIWLLGFIFIPILAFGDYEWRPVV